MSFVTLNIKLIWELIMHILAWMHKCDVTNGVSHVCLCVCLPVYVWLRVSVCARIWICVWVYTHVFVLDELGSTDVVGANGDSVASAGGEVGPDAIATALVRLPPSIPSCLISSI